MNLFKKSIGPTLDGVKKILNAFISNHGSRYLSTCSRTVLLYTKSFSVQNIMDLQPSDLLFIAIVLWLAYVIINSGGGGHRQRVPAN